MVTIVIIVLSRLFTKLIPYFSGRGWNKWEQLFDVNIVVQSALSEGNGGHANSTQVAAGPGVSIQSYGVQRTLDTPKRFRGVGLKVS